MDQNYVYATAAVILAVVLLGVLRKSFDPFAPVWLFLAGFFQVYVVQAITNRGYALRVRGDELVTAANFRALWSLLWFLAVYHFGPGKRFARVLPSPPVYWSTPFVVLSTPFLIVYGLFCAGVVASVPDPTALSAEEVLFRAFPFLMLLAAVMLIVTGRSGPRPRPAFTAAGLMTAFAYIMIWMVAGKRSPPLFGVLATVCSYYVSRGRRPPKFVLAATGLALVAVVSLALGFRESKNYPRSLPGFLQFVADYRPENALVNINLKTHDDEARTAEQLSHETEEYGGFLLMLDTVPEKSEYDYGASYLRLVSTYIPRVVWRDKPYFGREQWVNAWIAGSEFKRGKDFTGPAIGILGATQLNGGAWGTAIVLGVLALLLRTCYEFFRRYETCPWTQVWWSVTYYNSWLMVVNDDPFVWFYYVYGHALMVPLALIWLFHKFVAPPSAAIGSAAWDHVGPLGQAVRA